MTPFVPKCPNCGSPMAEGFIPDAHQSMMTQTFWHPGEAQDQKFLGIKTGTKVHKRELRPIRTYRCIHCGLLQSFALDEEPRKA